MEMIHPFPAGGGELPYLLYWYFVIDPRFSTRLLVYISAVNLVVVHKKTAFVSIGKEK